MERLIADIEQDAINTAYVTGIKHIDHAVLEAIRATDRRAFVRPQDQNFAYADRPLSIGCGQTISQPFVVALMIHLIEPKKSDKVLEVGSGSGYLVAVLAKLCHTVFGIEVIEKLAIQSRKTLAHEGITNASILCKDGNLGIPEHEPFDKIIVSAAAQALPHALLDQLAVNGLMVVPKCITPEDQVLVRIHKISSSDFKIVDVLPVRFVPLVNL